MRRIGGFSRAIDSVEGSLSSSDLWRGLRPHMAKIYWAEVAGEQVAAVTQVERVENGPDRCVLVVRAKNGVWANELTMLKGRLIDGLNERLGGHVITDLRFKGSGLSKTAPAEAVRPAKVTDEDAAGQRSIRNEVALHESERRRIEVAVSEIADADLRDKVHQSLVMAAQTALWRRKEGWVPCDRCGSLTPKSKNEDPPICPVCQVL